MGIMVMDDRRIFPVRSDHYVIVILEYRGNITPPGFVCTQEFGHRVGMPFGNIDPLPGIRPYFV
jgi:hypothetical protein